LRSTGPWERAQAAAILAILNTSWSRQELISAMEESDDWDMTLECRLALKEYFNVDVIPAIEKWEAEHPEKPISFGVNVEKDEEMSDAVRESAADQLQDAYGQLHDRVTRLRGRPVPPLDDSPENPIEQPPA
jgi:hypothetical protein